jgi:hypothetical protein
VERQKIGMNPLITLRNFHGIRKYPQRVAQLLLGSWRGCCLETLEKLTNQTIGGNGLDLGHGSLILLKGLTAYIITYFYEK